MKPLPRFRDPRLSLWQSSVEQVLRNHLADDEHVVIEHQGMMQAASFAAEAFLGSSPDAPPLSKSVAVATSGVLERCATLYLRKIYTTDPAEAARIDEQIAAFGDCDPRWNEAVAVYTANETLLHKSTPYIPPTGPNDSVFDSLPDRATIGFLSDWGTGTAQANQLLGQLAAMRSPDSPFFLIHLGDIYYSGTDNEVGRFVTNCREILGPDVPIFTLSGNHDMYASGQAYYQAIGSLNASPWTQRTSYFNLRNTNWQFQAMDTGLNDRNPWNVNTDTTFLEPAEAQWHQQQLSSAGTRKVVLLSHHQPFSAFFNIGTGFVNDALIASLGENLPNVTAWLWGHEHNMIFYDTYDGISNGRCIGSGAIPVTVADEPYVPKYPSVGFNTTAILDNDGAVYSHSFAIMEIDGPSGVIKYYQSPDPNGRNPIYVDEF